jgi:hypothetical protein
MVDYYTNYSWISEVYSLKQSNEVKTLKAEAQRLELESDLLNKSGVRFIVGKRHKKFVFLGLYK